MWVQALEFTCFPSFFIWCVADLYSTHPFPSNETVTFQVTFLFITFIMRNSACAHTQVLKCNKSEMPSSEKPAFSQPPFYHFPPNFSIRNYVHEYSLTFFCGLFPSFFPTFFPVRNSHNFTHEVISQHPSHNSHTRSSF